MVSLVLEGGSFRCIFSAGVMDALLDSDIYVPYCIGVSGGISMGVSYISKQPKRNLDVFLKYRNDKRYISRRNLLHNRSVFGLDFAYDEVPNKLIPFDWDTYKKYTGKVVIVATDALTGKPKYFNGMKMDKKFKPLRATCALPVAFPTIKIGNTPYYDGGLSDPIPIRKAIEDGCDKHIIILTRPEGYVKECDSRAKVVARVLRRKYPKVEECLLNRHIGYNKTVQFCEQLQKEKKAVIIRPDHPLESFEKDTKVLQESYDLGYQAGMKVMDQIKELFEEK
ncbi:patatin-like phospholipase [Lachnospiraceae bacterium KM106-2]|nr:patatin-like phospholipase [Lachnospiraceae bacterium KM106-2]